MSDIYVRQLEETLNEAQARFEQAEADRDVLKAALEKIERANYAYLQSDKVMLNEYMSRVRKIACAALAAVEPGGVEAGGKKLDNDNLEPRVVSPDEPKEARPWTWRGMAGHFICAPECCFRMHTTVGEYRISTVGCFHPADSSGDEPHEIGAGRLYETMVFREHDGKPVWQELDVDTYNDPGEAERGHIRMCEKWSVSAPASREEGL